MRSVSHLWILDCPVHNRATVQRQTVSQIYATIVTIMTAAIKPVGVTSLSTTGREMSDKTRNE